MGALRPPARPSVSASLFPPAALPRPRMLATPPRPSTARFPWRVGALDAVPETEMGVRGLLWEPPQEKHLAGAQGHPRFGQATKPFQPHIELSGRLAALRGRRGLEPGCCLQLGASLSVGSHLLPWGTHRGRDPGQHGPLPPSVPVPAPHAPTSQLSRPNPHTPPPPRNAEAPRGGSRAELGGRAVTHHDSGAGGTNHPVCAHWSGAAAEPDSGKLLSLITLPCAPSRTSVTSSPLLARILNL